MTPVIHGSGSILSELQEEIHLLSLESSRLTLRTLSPDAAQGAYQVLAIGVGASLTLLAQALVAYMQKRQGQRRITVQGTDKDGNAIRVEIETPRVDEVEDLLAHARDIFVADSTENSTEQMAEPKAGGDA